MEIWKDIIGYEGLYQVSNLGNVRSLNYRNTGKEKVLKAGKTKKGYLLVNLYKNGKMKTYLIHRLVYEAFKGPIPEGYQINHLSEIKNQNNLENLSLMTCKENVNFGTGKERSAKTRTNGKCSKPVLQYDLSGNVIREYPSAQQAERETGYSQSNISACCRLVLKQAYGFIWRYKEKVA